MAHALESAHAWHVPVDRLQIGAWGVVLQSLFERQLTHIPASVPASRHAAPDELIEHHVADNEHPGFAGGGQQLFDASNG